MGTYPVVLKKLQVNQGIEGSVPFGKGMGLAGQGIEPIAKGLGKDTARRDLFKSYVSASSPSSREALLPPSPLRTVQASFPAYCSSLSNAP